MFANGRPCEEMTMRKNTRDAAWALLVLITATGCASRTPVRVGVAAGPYYDGYYGAFHDGYWGDDGAFWYSDTGNSWHRDDGHHFQRTASNGFDAVHGSGMNREH
jgi:hypothetical protein